RGEHAPVGAARVLLGRATECVGRDVELSNLEASLNDCVEESTARAVLVTAPAGTGKSRLPHEPMPQAPPRGEAIAIWIGRANSVGAGSSFGLLGQALRGAVGIQESEPIDVRRQKLLAYVTEHLMPSEQRRVAEFLGELVGTPFPEEESEPLR